MVSNIRDALDHLIGQRLSDITQHDVEDWFDKGPFIEFLFEKGDTLRIYVSEEGFTYSDPDQKPDGFVYTEPGSTGRR